MKTNNKLHPVFTYLMEAINFKGSDLEKLHSVLIAFNEEHNFDNNKRRLPNLQNRFADWLQGLPSAIDIEYYNFDIIQLAKKWEAIPQNATEKQEQKILDNYWDFMSCKFFQLCKQNKVDYSFLY